MFSSGRSGILRKTCSLESKLPLVNDIKSKSLSIASKSDSIYDSSREYSSAQQGIKANRLLTNTTMCNNVAAITLPNTRSMSIQANTRSINNSISSPETPMSNLVKKDFSTPMNDVYIPAEVEQTWNLHWEQHDLYKPDESIDEKFVIVLPPPNVTGSLHLGHALTISIQDAIVRWNRMKGKSTLWVPGLDHAGIATQVVVEKQLARTQGLSRHDLGREKFVEEIWKWKETNGHHIFDQAKSLGASMDWSRARFTMDDVCAPAVQEAFMRMYENKQIYRANRLVTWSCALRSAISTIEVDHIDVEGSTMIQVPGHPNPVEIGVLHSFAYKVSGTDEEIVVSTTRIETMLGDVAVAVHPEDPRYKHLVGKKLIHPFIADREITIIADDILVDMDFGTGAVKITPAHDPNDFTCGNRHNLPRVNLLDDSGIMNSNAGPYSGMHRFEVREKIISDIEALGLYRGKVDNKMAVGICSRSKDIVEPIIRPQWWVNCQDMAARSVEVVRDGSLKLIPSTHDHTWYRWLENIQDWCISRQLWWGHRIPAYYAKNILANEVEEEEDPTRWVIAATAEEALIIAQERFPDEQLAMVQDEDVLDTWFSSGLFPFSTMGWPHNTSDYNNFFPGQLLETGQDILFFWVARMVMMSLSLTDRLPFNTVFLHTMVRDRIGRKMSKSLGNVIDPMDVIHGTPLQLLQQKLESGNLDPKEVKTAQTNQAKDFPDGIPQCGADALRFGLLGYTRQGTDINLDINRIVVARNFGNKLWQATRFALMHFPIDFSPPTSFADIESDMKKAGGATIAQRWILSKLHRTIEECDHGFNSYEFGGTTLALQRFFVDELCSKYLEMIKPIVKGDVENEDGTLSFSSLEKEQIANSHLAVLYITIETFLKLLHPLMPFITDELYHRLPGYEAKHDRKITSLLQTGTPTLREQSGSIMIEKYPAPVDTIQFLDTLAEEDMTLLDTVISSIRSTKSSVGMSKSQRPTIYLVSSSSRFSTLFQDEAQTISILGGVSSLSSLEQVEEDTIPAGCLSVVVNGDITLYVNIADMVDVAVEVVKTERKLREITQLRDNLDKTFAAPNYSFAKEDIKEKNKVKYTEFVSEIASLEKAVLNLTQIVSRKSYVKAKIADIQLDIARVDKNEIKTRSGIKAPKNGDPITIPKKTQDTLDNLAMQKQEYQLMIQNYENELVHL